ncbi:hypothetical protein NDU88_011683 [Pleurodeles waltl]|uniref:Uncharacterized protein n=1 Tax=Pleurodeles waltl TaxID=8319 RepID=A0AAV7QYE1_PLEWA|nr:hypothetical protein NDU88_011683 [Pleurodeles waltl]
MIEFLEEWVEYSLTNEAHVADFMGDISSTSPHLASAQDVIDDSAFRDGQLTHISQCFEVNKYLAAMQAVEWNFKVVTRGHCLQNIAGVRGELAAALKAADDSVTTLENCHLTDDATQQALIQTKKTQAEMVEQFRCINFATYTALMHTTRDKPGCLRAWLVRPETKSPTVIEI